ncbi:MAG TPA: DnaJ C-terminal domain-containing protein [Burkholderiaceae bacterium]
MKFKDYYQTLGVARDATQDDIKRSYRKLARKYHPDVSKERDAEARFKEIGEASEVLRDPEKRAAYDAAGSQWERQQAAGREQGREQDFQPPPGWDAGFEFSGRGRGDNDSGSAGDPLGGRDHSDFFEALFGRAARAAQARRGEARGPAHLAGEDHHAKVLIDLEDAYRGAQRGISLRMPALDDQGRTVMHERTLDVNIPKGIREGQHLRLAGQGGPGLGEGAAGDLYLEIAFNPHRRYRVDGRDVYLDLPVSPWEAALGAGVDVPTPDGNVELTVPKGSAGGRKLRLKGKGIPGQPAGDLYVVLTIALPPAESAKAKGAYEAFAAAFDFNPRAHLEG